MPARAAIITSATEGAALVVRHVRAVRDACGTGGVRRASEVSPHHLENVRTTRLAVSPAIEALPGGANPRSTAG
ncbi:hypothetical protein FMEAI12_4370009 [Parafrankia sp. Ea1.12]|nr:hypothetical protein FMEAI12_4370009 [Parafrankia sp. Ea1.12]